MFPTAAHSRGGWGELGVFGGPGPCEQECFAAVAWSVSCWCIAALTVLLRRWKRCAHAWLSNQLCAGWIPARLQGLCDGVGAVRGVRHCTDCCCEGFPAGCLTNGAGSVLVAAANEWEEGVHGAHSCLGFRALLCAALSPQLCLPCYGWDEYRLLLITSALSSVEMGFCLVLYSFAIVESWISVACFPCQTPPGVCFSPAQCSVTAPFPSCCICSAVWMQGQLNSTRSRPCVMLQLSRVRCCGDVVCCRRGEWELSHFEAGSVPCSQHASCPAEDASLLHAAVLLAALWWQHLAGSSAAGSGCGAWRGEHSRTWL